MKNTNSSPKSTATMAKDTVLVSHYQLGILRRGFLSCKKMKMGAIVSCFGAIMPHSGAITPHFGAIMLHSGA